MGDMGVNEFGEVEKLFLVWDKDAFVFFREEGDGSLVFFLVIHGISDGEAAHEIGGGSGRVGVVKEEMKVSGSEGVGKEFEAGGDLGREFGAGVGFFDAREVGERAGFRIA